MSATLTEEPAASWRQRRRLRRKTRPMYRRADRAVVRSLLTLTLPLLGLSVPAWRYFHEHDIKGAAVAAAIAGAVWLVLTPFALWWAVSGLRRGTRMILTGIMCGVVSGIGVVGLAMGTYGAAVAWTLMTGEPLPEPLQDITVPLPPGLR